jgi:PAS domain S-box-containing protein
MDQPTIRADILGKLLLIQQVLDVLPDNGGIAAFLRRALGEIPGVIDVHLCVGGAVFPPSDEFTEACARCEASWSASGTGAGTECLVGDASTICVPLRTARRLHGVLILSLGDKGAFSPYRGFVQNIANVVATTVETRQYLRQLDDARAGLEDQVTERTARLRASEEKFRTLVEATSDWVWEVDANGTYTYASPKVEALLGFKPEEVVGRTPFDLMPPDEGQRLASVSPAASQARMPLEQVLTTNLHKDGHPVVLETSGTPIFDVFGTFAGYRGIARDVTERVATEAERSRLLLAVEQTADLVWMQDLDNIVTYVNRSFSQVYGYEPDEIVGRHAGIIDSGRHEPAFFTELWASVASGKTWTGSIVNRRKDGTHFEVEAVISGIRDAAGRFIGYVQADRDVTHERAVEQELATGLRIRAAVAESLIGVRAGQDVREIAQAICDNVATVPQLDIASLVHFLTEDSAIVVAVTAPPEFPLRRGQVLPPGRSRYLYRRAKRGPWSARWKARVEDGEYGRAISASGLKATAQGPILHEGTPVGLLTIGTMHEEFAQNIITHAPALAEFSATSSALLAGPLDALGRRERERTDLLQIIASGAFGPVFQPIQDLAIGEIVGYEALTRFADGCRPDHRFESAWSVGLGIELELATLEAAVAAATGLPAGRWLDLNVSAASDSGAPQRDHAEGGPSARDRDHRTRRDRGLPRDPRCRPRPRTEHAALGRRCGCRNRELRAHHRAPPGFRETRHRSGPRREHRSRPPGARHRDAPVQPHGRLSARRRRSGDQGRSGYPRPARRALRPGLLVRSPPVG